MKRVLVAGALAAAALGPLALVPAVQAQSRPAAAAAALSAADQTLVDKARAYLQGLGAAKGRFTQTDPNGSTAGGTVYLQRPGKIRFEYDPARPLLVVSDGYNVKVYDKALKTFDQYPLGRTPLSLFLAKEVRLDRGVVVERVERLSGGGFAITARDGKREAEGKIRLVFSDGPVALREWSAVDRQGRATRVRLSGLTETASLDPKLFQLRDPTRRPGRP
jgi:outer membrane lipoprotein-sorting protein